MVMQYSEMSGVIEVVSYWVGSWEHILYSPDEIHDEEKIPVIRQLCFGPLESCEYGIDDGKFYFENKVFEGIDEGYSIFENIDKEHFLKVIENELTLCEKHAPQLLEQAAKLFVEICEKLKFDVN